MFKFFKGLKIPKHYRLWLVIGGSLIVLTGISFFIYRSVASAAGISLPGLPNIPSLPTIPGAVTGYFGDLTINVTDRLGNPIPNAEVKFVGSYKNSKSSKTLPSCTTQTLKTDGSGLAKFFEREDRKDNGKLIKKNLRIGTLPKNGKTKDYNSCVYTIYVNADGYYPSPIKNKEFDPTPADPNNPSKSKDLGSLKVTKDRLMTASLTNNVNGKVAVGKPFTLSWDVANYVPGKSVCASSQSKGTAFVAKSRLPNGQVSYTIKEAGTYEYKLSCTYEGTMPLDGKTTVQVGDVFQDTRLNVSGKVQFKPAYKPNGIKFCFYDQTSKSTQCPTAGLGASYNVYLLKQASEYEVTATLLQGTKSLSTTKFKVNVKPTDSTVFITRDLVFN